MIMGNTRIAGKGAWGARSSLGWNFWSDWRMCTDTLALDLSPLFIGDTYEEFYPILHYFHFHQLFLVFQRSKVVEKVVEKSLVTSTRPPLHPSPIRLHPSPFSPKPSSRQHPLLAI